MHRSSAASPVRRTSAAASAAAVASASSSATSSTGRGSKAEHKSAKRPAPSSISSGHSSASASRSRSPAGSAGAGKKRPRSRSTGSWYLVPLLTGPGPLPGRNKNKVDEFFQAAKRESLRSTALKERTRAKPERLTMEDWTVNKRKSADGGKEGEGEEGEEVKVLTHTVHGRSVARGGGRKSGGSSSKGAGSSSRSSSRASRSASPSRAARRSMSVDRPAKKPRLASKSAPSNKAKTVRAKAAAAVSTEDESASDSEMASESESEEGDEEEEEEEEEEGDASDASDADAPPRGCKPNSRQSSPNKSRASSSSRPTTTTTTTTSSQKTTPPAKKHVDVIDLSTPPQSTSTSTSRGKAPKAPASTDGSVTSATPAPPAASLKHAQAAQPQGPTARRLNMSSSTSSANPSIVPPGLPKRSASAGTGPAPRHTRQQVAAAMAVEEELEAQLCFDFARRACGTPTKLMHRRGMSPSPVFGIEDTGICASQPAKSWNVASVTSSTLRLTSAPSNSPSPPPSSSAASPSPDTCSSSSGSAPQYAALNESARRRLALSCVSSPLYLSSDWITKRAQKYLGVLSDADARAMAATRLANPNPQYVRQQESMGSLANGRVFVAVSAHADHNPFYLDEQRKSDPALHEALASKWVEIGGDSDEDMPEEGAGAGKDAVVSSDASARSSTPGPASSSSSSSSSGSHSGGGGGGGVVGGGFVCGSSKKPKERIPMLGLFAARDWPKGAWVTEYGGVLEWAGEARKRAQECNSHVRRISNSDWVWNGRPWSLLFPRIPSTLQWEAERPLSARTHLKPLVNPRTLINLLLLLHHEQETHCHRPTPAAGGGAGSLSALATGFDLSHSMSMVGPHGSVFSTATMSCVKSVQKPFTEADCTIRRICTGTCLLCRNELKVIRGRIECAAVAVPPPAPAPAPAQDAAASSGSSDAASIVSNASSTSTLPLSSPTAAPAVAPPSTTPVRTGPPDLTPEDVLATLLPQCAVCSVNLGLLPCEVVELMCGWDPARHQSVLSLCTRVEKELVRDGGLGYMANTDCKANQNVRVHSVSPFNKEIGAMSPTVHIYMAMRDIRAGEELLVAYNNNEAKKMNV